MTIRALVGIACLNLAYAFVGLSLLWGLRALRTWGEVGLLAGFMVWLFVGPDWLHRWLL